MSDIKVEVDPVEVGMDPKRLSRVDNHFKSYVDKGKLPGWSLLVTRANRVVHHSNYGFADTESKMPIESDTLFRIFSMTKPITSVAAMILFEEGRLELTDPVSKFIPSYGDLKIFSKGSSNAPYLVPAKEPMRIWHLLSHTSGLTYGFHYAHPVDAIYRSSGYEWGVPKGFDLAAAADGFASMPLLFEPGAEWNYSVSTDVLGRVVEVVSGMPLDEFFRTRILDPLGMYDTEFYAAEEDHGRLATLYAKAPNVDTPVRLDAMGDPFKSKPTYLSGGGGLVSTIGDYHRFTQMLLQRGEFEGVRILGSRTVDYMTVNHLPGGQDLKTFGRPLFSESPFDGVGFGLGFSVVIDAAANKNLSSAGQYAWGGAASTAFWIDPLEEITVIFMTQLLPSSTYPIRSQLGQLIYQSLFD